MRFLNTRTDPPERIAAALAPASWLDLPEAEAAARAVVEDVRARGDAAVRESNRRFQGCDPEALAVSEAEYAAAADAVDAAFAAAVETAAAAIRRFHEQQRPESWGREIDGAYLGQLVRPLDRVGVIVPAGQAPLPSTLLMAAVPARVAGVREVIACASPRADGSVDPHILVAARRAAVDRVFKAGGPAAVAAMAFGTASVPRVEKIVGPGSPYTVLAKRLVFGHVGIESLPGPTEVLVVADGSADPRWIAADLLSQAEHAEDSMAVLLTPCEALARATAAEVERQVAALGRAAVARACLAARGWVILTRDLEEACDLVNRCAPEHVELLVAEPDACLERIRHAGAVFIGGYTPEPVGDYLAGPSHVLPTGGTARFSSPLNVEDFVKRTSVLRYSRERFERDAPHVIRLAEAETLDAHANAIRVRLEEGPPR